MGKAFYNLRVRREQRNYRLSPPPPPPPSPPDSPPTPRRSRRRMYRDRRVFGEVSKRYEQLVLEANNAEEALQSAELNLAIAKENGVTVMKRLEELRSLAIKLEEQLDHGETEVVSWQSEVNQCSLNHSSVEAKVQMVGLEEEKAKKVVDEVNKRCEEASSGIALMKMQLWSLGMR